MRFAFDVGGVLSKYPTLFHEMIRGLLPWHEVYIISDMRDKDALVDLLRINGTIPLVSPATVYVAPYDVHGEACKAVLLRELGIDVLVDDHMGYLAWPWPEPAPLRLLVMPDPRRPYNAPEWGRSEAGGGFGRQCYSDDGGPP